MRFLIFFLLITQLLQVDAQSVDSLQLVLGKMEYSKESAFVQILEPFASKTGMYLRKDALESFKKMHASAKQDGVQLKIISASRNFNHQKSIWEAKWNGTRSVGGRNLSQTIPDKRLRALEILKYSSMPGTSRHHWGTDIDINSVSPSYFESGRGKKEYEWLRDNAHEFGFCQVYSSKGSDRKDGYNEEKWHWSYMPVASKLLQYYVKQVRQEHITGFEGSDAVPFSDKLKFVTGISPDCK